jgi:hypothetical protein
MSRRRNRDSNSNNTSNQPQASNQPYHTPSNNPASKISPIKEGSSFTNSSTTQVSGSKKRKQKSQSSANSSSNLPYGPENLSPAYRSSNFQGEQSIMDEDEDLDFFDLTEDYIPITKNMGNFPLDLFRESLATYSGKLLKELIVYS